MKTLLLILMGWSLTLTAQAASPGVSFSLKAFNETRTLNSSEFAGKIVVLDFFAYWCGPCGKSAPQIEQFIQKHYATKGGNPQAIPIQVISVNIEKDHPDRTAAFVKQHQPNLVAEDLEGSLLQKLDGASLPYLVILDGSKATKEHPNFTVVYKHAGFEGAEKLRKIIDAIGRNQP